MSTVAFHTLGCKVNFYDTEAMWHLFKSEGYQRVDFEDEADVYVINTCTVTHTGDRKSRQMIRRAVRRNPEATVVVTGCYAQMAPDEVSAIPGVDLVIGTQYRDRAVEWVRKVEEERRPYQFVDDIMKQREFEDMDVPSFAERTRASLKIQDGCNHFCTFCLIPHARGLLRSRRPGSVIRQAERLADAGYREIVLTGIHTGGYGEDLHGYTLADLLRDLEKIESLHRIRISSIEASEISDDLIDVLRSSNKVCRHLHVPLQAGDDAVLRRMNRHYTMSTYVDKIRKVRAALPEAAITSDVIVGFPGETDLEFEATCAVIEELEFAELHVFPYSAREGTPAAKFQDQVDEAVKEQRVQFLLEVSERLKQTYGQRFDGRVLEVIPEEVDADHAGFVVGHADNYLKVRFEAPETCLGAVCAVQMDRVVSGEATGTLRDILVEAPTPMERELRDESMLDHHPQTESAV